MTHKKQEPCLTEKSVVKTSPLERHLEVVKFVIIEYI